MGIEIAAFLAGAGAATLSRLIAREDGPYQVFSQFREWAIGSVRKFEAAHGESNPAPKRIEFLNEALEVMGCPICQSVWWGALLAVIYSAFPEGSPLWAVAYLLAAPSIAWAVGSLGKWFD